MGYHQRTHLTITTCTTIIAAAVAIDAVIQWLSGLDCFVLAFPVPQLHLAVGGNRQLGWAFPHLSTTYCLKEPSLPGFETHHPVRTQAIIERTQGHTGSTIGIGKLVVNLDTRIVSVDDQAVHLTGKEYAILELLTRRKGTIVTREMLLNHLYGGTGEPELKIIDVFVCKLRKKLAQATGGDHYIETVWGRGYMLHEPMATAATQTHVPMREAGLSGCSHR